MSNNRKFRYIITDIMDGRLRGTDDYGVARSFASNEDYFVYDSQEAVWIMADGAEEELEEAF